jgi:antirestriction protein ArdC
MRQLDRLAWLLGFVRCSQAVVRIDDLVAKLGVPVRYQAGDRAYYTVARDEGGTESITMPERSQFENSSDFLAVLLHEASHATGSTYPKRLCRPMVGVDGVESRAREELVAETASYFLLSELGLGQGQNTGETDGHALAAMSSTTARTAAYLSSWRELILADPKALFHAFGQAEKAADWVMQRHAIQLEAAAKLATDGQALGQDVRHAVDEVVSQHMTFQTKENTESQQHNPWATLPVVERPSIHGGFGMA